MGLFDYFKNKQTKDSILAETKINEISLSNFKFYYLYGLTDNPNKLSNDATAFNKLYKKVIGTRGGIIINNSFHPYYIVNTKGTTVWTAAYLKIYFNEKRDELFDTIINQNGIFMADTSTVFKDINVWPYTRLTHDENQIFSKYVPFIIPFLVYKSEEKTNWDIEINRETNTKENVSTYIDTVTQSIRFFMPEPAFILGFDEFDEKDPSKLINNFINCKSMLGESNCP